MILTNCRLPNKFYLISSWVAGLSVNSVELELWEEPVPAGHIISNTHLWTHASLPTPLATSSSKPLASLMSKPNKLQNQPSVSIGAVHLFSGRGWSAYAKHCPPSPPWIVIDRANWHRTKQIGKVFFSLHQSNRLGRQSSTVWPDALAPVGDLWGMPVVGHSPTLCCIVMRCFPKTL